MVCVAATARPMSAIWWDGKLGIFRDSKNPLVTRALARGEGAQRCKGPVLLQRPHGERVDPFPAPVSDPRQPLGGNSPPTLRPAVTQSAVLAEAFGHHPESTRLSRR